MYPLKNVLSIASYTSGISLRPSINSHSAEVNGRITSSNVPFQQDTSAIKPTAMKKLRLNVNPFLLLVFPLLLVFLSGIFQVKNRPLQNVHSEKEIPTTSVRKEIDKDKKAGQVSEVPNFLLY